MKKHLALLFIASLCLGTSLPAQTVLLEEYAIGFNWLVGFERAPGSDKLFVLQKDGFVKLLNPDGTGGGIFLDISAKVNNLWNNEQGLVGLAFHPDYVANGYFYVFYNQIGTGVCTVARYLRSAGNPNVANPNSESIMLTWEHPGANHVGGCLKFGHDGYLYIASGDGGGAGDPNGNGQNLLSFLGKILRIDVDNGGPYTVPAGNPFVGVANAAPEIWAYGLRNPWRFSFDRMTGDLWISDVGQDQREEVNFQAVNSLGGKNYGWSCKEGTLDFNANQCFANSVYTDPLFEYDHTQGDCSISGGVVYRGAAYGDLFGKYIYTDFCTGRIWALSKDGDSAEVVTVGDFNDNDFTILDEDRDGEIYVSGFFSNKIWRVKSQDCTPTALVPGTDTIYLQPGSSVELAAYPGVTSGFTYNWILNGNPVAGAISPLLNATQSGVYSVVITNVNNGCSAESNAVTILDAAGILNVAGDEEVCEGATSTYTTSAVAGASYQWTFSGVASVDGMGTNELTVIWGGQGTGHLNLAMTLPGGALMAGSLDVAILENDLEIFGVTTHISCFGLNDGAIEAEVSGSGEPFVYQWDSGQTTQSVSNLPPGAYLLEVFNSFGCEAFDFFVVETPPQVTIQFPTQPVTCFGDSDGAILAGVDSSFICGLSWDTPILENLPAGFYNVTITDCNGCTWVQEVGVLEPSPLVVTFSAILPTTGQSDGSLTANPSGGNLPYAYLWNTGEITKTITNLPFGTYWVDVTDNKGCMTSDTFHLGPTAASEVLPVLDLQVSPNPAREELHISFTLPQAAETEIVVADVLGNLVEMVLPRSLQSAGELRLDLGIQDWQAGVYFIDFQVDGRRFTKKFIKI